MKTFWICTTRLSIKAKDIGSKSRLGESIRPPRSLTVFAIPFHEPHGARILGYDNAHGVKPAGKFKYAGRIMTHDHTHRHKEDKGTPYEFQDAQQLLIDFFEKVDRVLQEVRKK